MSDFIVLIITVPIIHLSMMLMGFIMYKIGRGVNFGRAICSREAQTFAAKYCGIMIIKFMLIFLIPMIATLVIGLVFFAENETAGWILMVVQIGIMTITAIIPLILTHKATCRLFDENGKPIKQ